MVANLQLLQKLTLRSTVGTEEEECCLWWPTSSSTKEEECCSYLQLGGGEEEEEEEAELYIKVSTTFLFLHFPMTS